MNPTPLDRHSFPPGGWQFYQPHTGWRTPTPLSSTFEQTKQLIRKHRMGNPAIVLKHKLKTDMDSIDHELMLFNSVRLGRPMSVALPKSQPPPHQGPGGGGVAAVNPVRNSVAFGLKRAAQGTAVVLDWLSSGGTPAAQDLADKRAAICVACQFNVPGSWFTTAPAEVLKDTLEARKDLKLETPYDDRLKSCHICRCLLALKVWCPLDHILKKTNPEIMSEFPAHCWIAKRDQI